jgi:hypothetical protein
MWKNRLGGQRVEQPAVSHLQTHESKQSEEKLPTIKEKDLAEGGSASIPLQNDTEMLKSGHLQLAAYTSQSYPFLDAKKIEDASTVVQAQITELETTKKEEPRGTIQRPVAPQHQPALPANAHHLQDQRVYQPNPNPSVSRTQDYQVPRLGAQGGAIRRPSRKAADE